MRRMNPSNAKQADRTLGFKEKVIMKLCDSISEKAVDPRGCWLAGIYEPEIPPEIILELAKR